MHEALFVAFALAIQAHPTANDRAFQYAQESFVMSAVPRMRPPADVMDIINLAGADDYCARETASKWLRKVDARWLMYGIRGPDLEIRLRCNRVLQWQSVCPACIGSGLCQYKPKDADRPDGECVNCGRWSFSHGAGQTFEYAALCKVCHGTANSWPYSIFELPGS